MTAHDHSTRAPGCYRCELGEDEVRAQQTDPVHSEAVRRKVEDLCHEIGRLRQELAKRDEAINKVREIHRPVKHGTGVYVTTCIRCLAAYPCRTIVALDGAK